MHWDLISGITNAIFIDQNLIVCGKRSLKDGDVTSGGVVGNVEDVTGVGVGSTEDGRLVHILVHLHINTNSETTGIQKRSITSTCNGVGNVKLVRNQINRRLECQISNGAEAFDSLRENFRDT